MDKTLDEFREEMYDFFHTPGEDGKTIAQDLERFDKDMEQLRPYLHMTEEEMQKAVPEGAYQIGGGSLVAWTGKAGFINYILLMKKELFPNEQK